MSANYVNIAGGTTYTLAFNPATLTLQNSQFRLVCKTVDGAITINLPAISDFGNNIDTKIFIEDADDLSATNNITVVCHPSNTIANSSSYIINENGKKVEVFISSIREFGVLGTGIGGGAGQDTLLGIGAYSEYPIANSPSQQLIASGVAKVYGILQLMTQPLSAISSNLTTISFPDLKTLIGGIDFQDDGTALLENLSFSQLNTNIISDVTISGFNLLNFINFPAIKKLTYKAPSSTFVITGNAVLPLFSLPSLTDIESTDNLTGNSVLVVNDCPSVESVSYPNLANADKSKNVVIAFGDLPICSSIDLPSLIKGFFGANGTCVVALQNVGLITSFSLPSAVSGISVSVDACPMIISISASNLTTSGGIYVVNNPILTSLSFPALTSSTLSLNGGVDIRNNDLLPSFSFPLLTLVDYILIEANNSLTQAFFPALVTAGYNSVRIDTNNSLTSLSFPLLMTVGGDYYVYNNTLLATLTQPSLTIITNGGLNINTNPALTSVSILNLLSSPFDVIISDNPLVTTININMALTVLISGNYKFNNNALTQACVDDILAKLDSGGLSTRNLDLTGGTNATPSAAGLVSKANLVGKGWTVTNN